MQTITLEDINSPSDPDFLALNADVLIEDTSLDELENRVVVGVDFEVEHNVVERDPDDGRLYVVCVDDNVPVENFSCYWTTTGDNPVLDSLAAKNDQRSRLLNEILPPPRDFYSAAKPNPNDKICYRNFLRTMLCLRKNAGDLNKLRELWRRFWKKFWELKEIDDIAIRRNNPICPFKAEPELKLDKWLKPWHIKRIRIEFNDLGIKSRSKK